jgi:hypothetical protein
MKKPKYLKKNIHPDDMIVTGVLHALTPFNVPISGFFKRDRALLPK